MTPRAARVFWATCALYVAVGLWLALEVRYYQGDSLSRVSAARTVFFFSRDPHLAAIGFVFTPLTAIGQLPLVALSGWFPDLTRFGITAVTMSAPFMAGAVVQVHKLACDRGCATWLVWTVTVLFALNPMIVYYGANGMSEAPFLMLLCWAVRRLIRWSSTDDVHDLAFAGVAIGIAYLARYDALAVGGAATVFVMIVARWRTRTSTPRSGTRRFSTGSCSRRRSCCRLSCSLRPAGSSRATRSHSSRRRTATQQFSSRAVADRQMDCPR